MMLEKILQEIRSRRKRCYKVLVESKKRTVKAVYQARINELDDVEKLLRAYMASERKWVPFTREKEHQPDEHGEYLVTDSHGIMHIARYSKVRGEFLDNFSVAAWMPLPEAYKS